MSEFTSKLPIRLYNTETLIQIVGFVLEGFFSFAMSIFAPLRADYISYIMYYELHFIYHILYIMHYILYIIYYISYIIYCIISSKCRLLHFYERHLSISVIKWYYTYICAFLWSEMARTGVPHIVLHISCTSSAYWRAF